MMETTKSPKKITWGGNNSSSTREYQSTRIDTGVSQSDESADSAPSGLRRLYRSAENLTTFAGLSTLSSLVVGSSWGPDTPSRTASATIPEDPDELVSQDNDSGDLITGEPQSPPLSLEGTLTFRKCHTSDNLKSWRQAYVVFDMRDGGSISCYKTRPSEKKHHTHIIHSTRQQSGPTTRRLSYAVAEHDDMIPRIHLPAHVNWVAKDIQNNASGFIIEIPSAEPLLPFAPLDSPAFPEEEKYINIRRNQQSNYDLSAAAGGSSDRKLPDDLKDDIDRAKTRGQSFRIYFRCSLRGNEKVLWLRAFEQMERLSPEFYRQQGIRNIFGTNTLQISTSRTRSQMARIFANEGKALESPLHGDDGDCLSFSDREGEAWATAHQSMRVRRDLKEFRVYPQYAYPNRWMTESELYTEMIKSSDTFHDLRRPEAPQKEIGILKVELLQCIGLPALDFASETDAVGYLVCGSYVFTSDVIWNKLNPIWLPRSRRACIFPLFHAYARLFLGIFDDDGKGEKDDFAGRVILDLAQCRPRSTYDVTLPLRLSRDVYSKRPRGSVRLRFTIEYHSERDAILSYIPRGIRRPTSIRPDDDVTVICADEKAFRNIVTTVHGIHMPGRFSFAEWRAVMREANFARKVSINVIIDLLMGIVKWENPALSFLVFCAWMHGTYKNAFSLVPFYLLSFLFLTMVRTYAFFGSDGPIQQGFTPPSWEEMFMALIKGGTKPRIEPIKTIPPQSSRRAIQSSRRVQQVGGESRTHRQRGNWIFRLLGFKKTLGPDHDPKDYHMEFAFSQGLRNPMTQETQYPNFTVAESLVSKSSIIGKNNKKKEGDDDGDILGGDGMDVSQRTIKSPRRRTFDLFSPRSSPKNQPETVAERRNSFAAPAKSSGKFTIKDGSQKIDTPGSYKEINFSFENLPPRLRLPEQNADAKGPARKKKLGDELAELRDNLHKLSFHLFNDRTHRLREGTCYFGTAQRGRTLQTENELERLLNVGQYSSANPVVARVGLYVEPIISAAHSGLSLSRVVYNVFTWRDPFLSFWVSLAFLASSFVLAIFPWRLFFFVTGCVVVGPQNYVLRVMDERGTTPKYIRDFVERRRKKAEAAKAQRKSKQKKPKTLPQDQPIISSHSSDNSPPAKLSFNDVDPRELHEVCIPYSQLMYHRTYDWPPEPAYAKCNPTADMEQFLQRTPRNRSASRDALSASSHHTWRSTSSQGDLSTDPSRD